MKRGRPTNAYLMSATSARIGGSKSVAEKPATTNNARVVTREQAERIISRGQFTAGDVVVHVFDNRLSRLPQITMEELADTDIVIHSIKGTIDAGKFGPSYVLEVGDDPKHATHSWLVNCSSVIGKQLEGHKGFPLMAHVAHVTPDEGNAYYTLGVPDMLRAALDSGKPDEDLSDLPF